MFKRFLLLSAMLCSHASIWANPQTFTNLADFEQLCASEQVKIQQELVEKYDQAVQTRENSNFLMQHLGIGMGAPYKTATKLNAISQTVLAAQTKVVKRRLLLIPVPLLGVHALFTGLCLTLGSNGGRDYFALGALSGFLLVYHAMLSSVGSIAYYSAELGEGCDITTREISRIDSWKAMIRQASDIAVSLKKSSSYGTIKEYASIAKLLEDKIKTARLGRLAIAGGAAALVAAAAVLCMKVWDGQKQATDTVEN